jgi:hypothetical protein
MICDFCSAPNPKYVCPCRVTRFSRDWMACGTCAGLIRCRQWTALAHRSVEESSTGQLMEEILSAETALAKTQEHHAEYRKNATGEPRRREG